MKSTKRKLVLRQETIRTLSPGALRGVAGGIGNYDTSINHRTCSSNTVIDTCFTDGVSYCGPCYTDPRVCLA